MPAINVTKAFLPPIEEYQRYIAEIWKSDKLTNHGPLLQKLEAELKARLDVENLHFVANGTLALQLALRVFDIKDSEVITTPFSYVATTSSILWEGGKPVFVDIEQKTFCIDAEKIEAAITPRTKAIVPVHVFGYPCDVEKINDIAQKYNLPVIYDAAHAFGARYKNKSLLSYGDISTCSFHATKPFHTVEGGCVIAKEKKISDKVELMKRFGHHGDEHKMLGINAKASEFHAAMGLCNLPHVANILTRRQKIVELYDKLLEGAIRRPVIARNFQYNYAYYPVVFDSEAHLQEVSSKLKAENIFLRRYFYPSLNELPYLEDKQSCPISEDISKRIACLPLYEDLGHKIVKRICDIVRK